MRTTTRAVVSVGFVATLAFCLIVGAASATVTKSEQSDGAWSADLDCSACHQAEAESLLGDDVHRDAGAEEGNRDVERYAEEHAEELGVTCTTCHEPSEALEKAHAKMNGGKTAKRLKKTEVSSESCLACHEQEDLASATASYRGIVDANGTVVNPHDLPATDDHADIACTDCHRAHDTSMSVEESAMATCKGCHHAGVFECGTCH